MAQRLRVLQTLMLHLFLDFITVHHGAATMHTVGGETQRWDYPPRDFWYEEVWAKSIIFRVGDQLGVCYVVLSITLTLIPWDFLSVLLGSGYVSSSLIRRMLSFSEPPIDIAQNVNHMGLYCSDDHKLQTLSLCTLFTKQN